jgi:hypothetical protein
MFGKSVFRWMTTVAGPLALLASACSPPSAPPRDITPELIQYQQSLANRLTPSILQLPDGQCLDFSRLPPPWLQINADAGGNTLEMAATGDAVGIRPDTRGDGVLRVTLQGWRRPEDLSLIWQVASPERIDENIRTALLKRISLWSDNALRLEAYSGPGLEFTYVDARRYTQCRDYGETGIIRCIVVSDDNTWALSTILSGAERGRLPVVLQKLTNVAKLTIAGCAHR